MKKNPDGNTEGKWNAAREPGKSGSGGARPAGEAPTTGIPTTGIPGGQVRRCGRRGGAAAVLVMSGWLLRTASIRSEAFADWYASVIYPVIVGSVGRVAGFMPFSVAEVMLYVLLVWFVISLMSMIRSVWRVYRISRASCIKATAGATCVPEYPAGAGLSGEPGIPEISTEPGLSELPGLPETLTGQDPSVSPRAPGLLRSAAGEVACVFFSWVSGVMLAGGILVVMYMLGCGINYNSRTFSEKEGLRTAEYGAEELTEVCEWLTDEINGLAVSVARDEDGVMIPVGGDAVHAMEELAESYPSLEGYYPQPKELIVSELLSYQGLTGVYSPFTIEANYNGDMTGYNIPFTMCHELSHLRGFMEEKEANFIAFLACISCGDPGFKYSGYLSGWVYCTNALYRADRESWDEISDHLSEAAWTDVISNNDFWDSYEGEVSEAAERVNDTYLRANGQAEGVKGYDRMVDLIVAYYLSTDPDEE